MNEAGLCQFAFCCQDDRDKMQGTIRNVCNDLGGIAKVMVHVVDENGESEIVQEIKDTEEKHFFSKAKISERKIIKQFGTEVYGMETLFNKSNIVKEDIVYSFNSSQKGFFVMSDGSILNATVRANGLTDSYYISSRSTNFAKIDKDIIDRPLSSCIVPSGCILEFFDKVVLIQNSQSLSLVNHSVNSVRSYTSSTNYRNIVSVVDDDKVTFCSIFGLDSLNHKLAFPKIPVPANGFEPIINEKWGKDLPF